MPAIKITKEEVLGIAKKAKLILDNNEVKKYQAELAAILEFIDKMKEVDTEGVSPTYQVNHPVNVVRKDKVRQCDPQIREQIIKNFPDKIDTLLKIPPVL